MFDCCEVMRVWVVPGKKKKNIFKACGKSQVWGSALSRIKDFFKWVITMMSLLKSLYWQYGAWHGWHNGWIWKKNNLLAFNLTSYFFFRKSCGISLFPLVSVWKKKVVFLDVLSKCQSDAHSSLYFYLNRFWKFTWYVFDQIEIRACFLRFCYLTCMDNVSHPVWINW